MNKDLLKVVLISSSVLSVAQANAKTNATDITDAIFSNGSTHCADYANEYVSNVKDINNDTAFSGGLKISVKDDKCVFVTDTLPNHHFNDGKRAFRHPFIKQNTTYTIAKDPKVAAQATPLSLAWDNAVFLNGVKLDILAAGCFGIRTGTSGCNNPDQPFRYDPMSPLNTFATDSHNAHTQPNGAYHYHGNPQAMFADDSSKASPVIGFAADGFPIFGSYIDDNGTIRKAKSSYVLKSNGGPRPAVTFEGETFSPGGNYDGQFVDDHVYKAGSGDLDECNGMTVNGKYAYYVTDSYPWVLGCFKGTPDESFRKRRGRRLN